MVDVKIETLQIRTKTSSLIMIIPINKLNLAGMFSDDVLFQDTKMHELSRGSFMLKPVSLTLHIYSYFCASNVNMGVTVEYFILNPKH